MMRRLSVAVACMLALTACTPPEPPTAQPVSSEEYAQFEITPTSLGDPALLRHVEDSVEADLVDAAEDPDHFVENVQAIYYSTEYLEEVAYNSRANIYFGYTLAELERQFQGQKYVFAPDGDGRTIAKPFEEYDDTYDQVIRNVAVGGGVILLCVTVAAIAPAAGAPAVVSVVVAASAKSAAIFAGSEALLGAVVAAVLAGVETGNLEEALEEAARAGSEGFMWGAITGVLGAASLSALRGATKGGLSLGKSFESQRAGHSLRATRRMRDPREVDLYKAAGLRGRCKFMGNGDLLRSLDPSLVVAGLANRERMWRGDPPLDPRTGEAYELHHIGQDPKGPLAVLTKQEHRIGENYSILHKPGSSAVEHGSEWLQRKKKFWRTYVDQLDAGVLAKCLA